ncbi:MAG TPA: hypothetical protein PK613_22490 [Anaerolineaceae bacterium]|nr:hypothetical protein [Anaerolineaceae bacterium]
MIDSTQAVKIFIEQVYYQVYQAAIHASESVLQEDPPKGMKESDEAKLKQWFLTLSEEDKKNVLQVVKETAQLSVFCFLVLIDNKKVGYPIEDEVSDLALYYQTYENEENCYNYKPAESIRINMSYSEEDLHDEFLYMVHDLEHG